METTVYKVHPQCLDFSWEIPSIIGVLLLWSNVCILVCACARCQFAWCICVLISGIAYQWEDQPRLDHSHCDKTGSCCDKLLPISWLLSINFPTVHNQSSWIRHRQHFDHNLQRWYSIRWYHKYYEAWKSHRRQLLPRLLSHTSETSTWLHMLMMSDFGSRVETTMCVKHPAHETPKQRLNIEPLFQHQKHDLLCEATIVTSLWQERCHDDISVERPHRLSFLCSAFV